MPGVIIERSLIPILTIPIMLAIESILVTCLAANKAIAFGSIHTIKVKVKDFEALLIKYKKFKKLLNPWICNQL